MSFSDVDVTGGLNLIRQLRTTLDMMYKVSTRICAIVIDVAALGTGALYRGIRDVHPGSEIVR